MTWQEKYYWSAHLKHIKQVMHAVPTDWTFCTNFHASCNLDFYRFHRLNSTLVAIYNKTHLSTGCWGGNIIPIPSIALYFSNRWHHHTAGHIVLLPTMIVSVPLIFFSTRHINNLSVPRIGYVLNFVTHWAYTMSAYVGPFPM